MTQAAKSILPVHRPRDRRARRAAYALAALALSLLVAGFLWLARDLVIDEASETEEIVARVVAHQIDQTVQTSRFLLAGMALRVEPAGDLDAGARAALAAMADRLAYEPYLAAVSVHDARGTSIAAGPSVSHAPDLIAADLAAIPANESYGVGVVRRSGAGDDRVWPVVRRIARVDGAETAYAAVWIDLDRLRAELADAADLDARALLAVRRDGTVLFRIPGLPSDPAGADISAHSVFARVAAGEARGTFIGPSPFDGRPRVAGFAQGRENGVIVVTSRAESDVLRDELTNGGEFAVMAGAGLIFLVAGALVFVFGRHRMRAASLERDGLLDSLELADAGIAIADAETQSLVYVNPAFERMTGYTAAEMIGKNCRVLQGSATDPATVASIRERLSRSQPVRVDILNYTKGGAPYWSDLSIVPVRGPDGAPRAFVSAFTDVTARVEMTARLEDSLARAHAADRAKSAFLARMSHELRTPLNAIIGFSETIRLRVMGPLPERYADYAGDIYDSGRHLLELVERILEMARLEADGRVLEARPVDLADIARAAATLSRAAVDGAAARLVLDLDGPAPALGDPTALRQIAVNLVANAARHGKKGGTIRVRTFLADGGRARLEVADDGPGLPPELIERVGTPFLNRRADTADGQGVGLGLAISMELAKRMGGTLTIANAHPGLRATLDLPRAGAARNAA